MALFQAQIIRQDRQTVSKSLLLNTKRVINQYEDSDNKVVFYYNLLKGRRTQTVEFKFDGTMQQFRAKVIEADVNEWIHVETVAHGPDEGNMKTITRDYEIRTDDIVYAEDVSDSTYSHFCHMYVEHGNFELYIFHIPFSISELDASASTSGSMSRVL